MNGTSTEVAGVGDLACHPNKERSFQFTQSAVYTTPRNVEPPNRYQDSTADLAVTCPTCFPTGRAHSSFVRKSDAKSIILDSLG